MPESVVVSDASHEPSSTATRGLSLGPASGPRLAVSRRDVLVGGLAAAVAAGGATVALLALDDDGDGPPAAHQPPAPVVEPSPSATRPPSVEVTAPANPANPAGPPEGAAEETEQRTPADPAGDEQDESDDRGDGGSSSPSVPLLGVVGALLAAGALEAWRRYRARPPMEPPLEPLSRPGPRLGASASAGAGADGESLPEGAHGSGDEDAARARRLEAALVHLARNVRPRPGEPCPQPRVVQVGDDRIDVVLSEPDPLPPSPWRPEASGRLWIVGAHTALAAPQPQGDAFPLPALVTVGTGESRVLVDVEAYGVVALVGHEDACRNVARAMVTELSTRAEGLVTVEIVGDLLGDALARLDGVDRHASWDDVDTGIIGTSARLLDSGGWPHTWAARASGRIYDGWAPTVWFTGASPGSRYREALEAVASRPGAGTAMVVVGDDPGCGLRIRLDGQGGFEIPDLQLSGTARTLAPGAMEVAGSAG